MSRQQWKLIQSIILAVLSWFFLAFVPIIFVIPITIVLILVVRTQWKKVGIVMGEYMVLKVLTIALYISCLSVALLEYGGIDPLTSLVVAVLSWLFIHYGIKRPWLL